MLQREMELLASAIRSDKSIKGLSLDSKEFKLSEYADDTTCLVQDTSSTSNIINLHIKKSNKLQIRLPIGRLSQNYEKPST